MEDVGDPAYQYYAFRFAEKMVERYKDHPALFAFGYAMKLEMAIFPIQNMLENAMLIG